MAVESLKKDFGRPPPPPYRNCLKIVLSVLVSRVEGRILKPKEFEILSSF